MQSPGRAVPLYSRAYHEAEGVQEAIPGADARAQYVEAVSRNPLVWYLTVCHS